MRHRTILLVTVGAVAAFGFFRYAAGERNAHAQANIKASLHATGNSWAMVEMSGGRAHLRGHAPSDAGAERAIEAAKLASCESWLGSRACARSVSSDFSATQLAWPHLEASIDRNVLTLAGHVPDKAMHGAVVDRARGAVRRGDIWRVVDHLVLMDRAAPPGVDATAGRVAAVAALCDTGGATFVDGFFSVDCEVSRELERTLRELIDAPLHAGYLGDVRVVVTGDTSMSAP